MERKFLEELGLEKEAIDKIMAENGKDIESQKALTLAESEKLKKATETISQLQDTVKQFDGVDVEKLKSDVAEWETKYNDDLAKVRLENALEMALVTGKAKNTKAVKALLDLDSIKLDGDNLLGLDTQLEKLKADASYLFEEKTTDTKLKASSGANHQEPLGDEDDSFFSAARKAAGITKDED